MPRSNSRVRFLTWTVLVTLIVPTACLLLVAGYVSFMSEDSTRHLLGFQGPEEIWFGGIAVALLFILCAVLGIAFWYHRTMMRLAETQARDEANARLAEELRDLYDNASTGHHSLDKDGRIVRINATELAWLGRTQAEVVNALSFSELLTPESRQPYETALVALREEGSVHDLELELACIGGTTRSVLLSATAMRTASGEYLGGRVALVDITERKRSDKALREHAFWLHESQRVGRIGSYYLNIEENTWTSSTVLDEIFGLPAHVEKNIEAWTTIIHSEERDEMQRYLMEEVITGRARFDREYRIVRVSDGAIRWVHGLGELSYDAHGASVRMFGTIQDITDRTLAEQARRRSEEEFRTLARVSPVGIFRTDEHGGFTYWNETIMGVTGITAEQASGDGWHVAVHPDDLPRVVATWRQCVDAGAFFKMQFRCLRKDRSVIWVVGQAERFEGGQGDTPAWIGTITDISEIKTAEREIQDARERAERSDKLKDHFIATISHEIRTPLNVILGFTEAVEGTMRSSLTDQQRLMFRHINSGSSRLIRTVDLILNISRAHAGDFTLMLGEVDLAELAQQHLDNARASIGRKDLELRLIVSTADTHVRADRYCMDQVLGNLIDNAVKFTPAGTVSLRMYQNAEGESCIDIVDTGIGISEAYFPYLFTAYSQEDIGYSRSYEGIGLGLALVKKYLDLHGFTITVQSVKGEGTTFTVRFQNHVQSGTGRVALPQSARAEARAKLPAEPEEDDARTCLLVVEDDPDTIDYMETILAPSFRTQYATNSDEALAILHSHRIDIVLMDISIQGPINGLGITQIIRSTPELALLPVIAVTAHAFPADRDTCLRGGCDEYLSKPIRPLELFRMINRFIRK